MPVTQLERIDWILEESIRQMREIVDGPGKELVDRREMGNAFVGVLAALRLSIVDVLMGREDGGQGC
jgi:hypothetical protein